MMRIVSFVILWLFGVSTLSALNYNMDLFHWDVSSGLSDGHITCFEQDEKGFIWMGTRKGILRFDGREYLHFELPVHVGEDWIEDLKRTSHKLIITTNKRDIYWFDTRSMQFVSGDEDPNVRGNSYSKQDRSFKYVVALTGNDSITLIWDGNGKLEVDGRALPGSINSVFKDSKGTLWLGSPTNGLGYFNSREGAVTYVGEPVLMTGTAVNHIAEAPDGKIWFEMPFGGLGFWDGRKMVSVKNIADYPNLRNGYTVLSSLIDFNITTLFFDAAGNLWIGTSGNGFFRIGFKPQYFQTFKFDYRSKAGLAHKDVSFPLVTSTGDIWIGTWGGGINVLSKEMVTAADPVFHTIGYQPGIKGALQRGLIFPLLEDRNKNMWLGIHGGGVQFISQNDIRNRNYRFKLYNREIGGLPGDSVWALIEDAEGIIWAGTTRGLSRYLPEEDRFEMRFEELNDAYTFRNKDILMLFGDGEGMLWVATRNNGLFSWNRKNNQLKQYRNAGTESLNGLLCASIGPDSSLWFGGINGLFYFDPEMDHFKSVNDSIVLLSYHIESILLGRDGRLWLGTGQGLVAYHPPSNQVEQFRMTSGVMSNSFTQGASGDRDGHLYFGSRNGFYRFDPMDLKQKIQEDSIAITNFEIHGTDFREDTLMAKEVLKGRDIASIDHLELKHDENTITIGYRCLDYFPNDNKEYELLMEGLDTRWISTFDNNRTWSDLNPGSYVFHVRLKGQEKEVILSITIVPPWWASVWAYLIFSILLLAGMATLLIYSNRKVRVKEKRHQKELYDQLRFRFFLNVSHEIRTPLTLIKGGIDRLVDNKAVNARYQDELMRVQRNTKRLNRMVNEVLDLKKMESREVTVEKGIFNLKTFLEASVDVFRLRDEGCRFALELPDEPVWILSDRGLIETILYNLLSNALKYSSPGLVIRVKLECGENKAVFIRVIDQGVGIKEEEHKLIFERYYRSANQIKTGAGIGLSIVKQYAGLLGGTIMVDSELGRGSTFTLQLPDCLVGADQQKFVVRKVEPVVGSEENKPVLVLVDDQADIRAFVREIFEYNYIIHEASNGESGWALIKEKMPDLVISDVMMPGMNGYELCNAVRENINTCHIPLILLTAKTGDEAQMDAFESKVDAFINKPFNQDMLRLRVEKLIEHRRQLIQKYEQKPDEKTEVLATNLLDRSFLEKMELVISERLDDETFSVEELASLMAMSSSGLYRKIKALTNHSPIEYIRIFRLKSAALMLRDTSQTVTEISEATGFSTQKYFSKCFKQQFGITPLNYRKGG
ncbi:MAG: response regulator [Marinilabiliaceae bacterium]|nr:response regulator [Marinilabiliaceae bacterium]